MAGAHGGAAAQNSPSGQRPAVSAAAPASTDETLTNRSYRVTQFIPSFDGAVPRRPPLEEVMRYEVELGVVDKGLVEPSSAAGARTVKVPLGDIIKLQTHDFYPTAINAVAQQLEAHLEKRGFTGLEVIAHPQDITAGGEDVRFPNQTALRLLVQLEPPPAPAPAPTKPADKPADAAAAASADAATGEMPRVTVPPAPKAALVEATEKDGSLYPVSQIILEYAEPHPAHPPLIDVMEGATVRLAESAKGYVAAPQGVEGLRVRLADIPLLSKPYLYGSAIQAISRAIVSNYSERGYIGINVAPHPEEIGPQANDLRPEGLTALRMLIRIGIVTEVRTIAAGDRVPAEERINNEVHAEIVEKSPVRPSAEGDAERTDLLRKNELDNYISWLNRHPTRRVDVAVSPARQPGGVALDFLITESKPWMLYAQLSNTGTEQTSEWRERLGFVHHQLTGNDDTLALDYITADFEHAHTVLGSYEAPFFDAERIRWRANGQWSQYEASDVGFADQEFEGDEWAAGGDLILNVYQRRELFVDLLVGAELRNIHTKDVILNSVTTEGETDFFLPRVGLQLERYTETTNTFALVNWQINVPGIAGTDGEEMGKLGRTLTETAGGDVPDEYEAFWRLTWDATHAFYLEPLLNPEGWLDATTPESSTLAHEIALSFKGQHAPDDKLTPQFQRTVGGLYSVRGYDESLVSGDSVVILSAEYRFHLPRIFAIDPDPGMLFGQPFRYAPQQVYGRPDWDLIFRGFVDYGRTWLTDSLNFEEEFDLASAGVGVELLVKRNVNVRVDWGFVLQDVKNRAEEGDDRVHIVATFLY